MPGDLTPETFRPHIGDAFRLELEGGELHLELVEVEEGGSEASSSARAAGLRTPFSIVLRGPHDPLLPQGTYSVMQEAIGAFPRFIVPIGQDELGTQYQAIFA